MPTASWTKSETYAYRSLSPSRFVKRRQRTRTRHWPNRKMDTNRKTGTSRWGNPGRRTNRMAGTSRWGNPGRRTNRMAGTSRWAKPRRRTNRSRCSTRSRHRIRHMHQTRCTTSLPSPSQWVIPIAVRPGSLTSKETFRRLPSGTRNAPRTSSASSAWIIQRTVMSSRRATAPFRLRITAYLTKRMRAVGLMGRPHIAAARAYCSESGLGLDRTQSVDDRQLAGRACCPLARASRHRLRDLVATWLSGLQDPASGQRPARLPWRHLFGSVAGPFRVDAVDARHADSQSDQYHRGVGDLLDCAAGP